ncbi:MAG: hypothetical protein ACYC5N_01155 [Endomicrobiales bacterium]
MFKPLVLLLLIARFSMLFAAGSPDAGKLPIVYSPRYDITLFGIEKLQHFDSTGPSSNMRVCRRIPSMSRRACPRVTSFRCTRKNTWTR